MQIHFSEDLWHSFIVHLMIMNYSYDLSFVMQSGRRPPSADRHQSLSEFRAKSGD